MRTLALVTGASASLDRTRPIGLRSAGADSAPSAVR
jgi:hypothetical protein